MTRSISKISITQKKSDDKRGVKIKAFKVPIATIDLIERLSIQTGKPHNALLIEAFKLLEEKLTHQP